MYECMDFIFVYLHEISSSSLHASRSKHLPRRLQAELGRSLADLGLNAATGRDARNWTKIAINPEVFSNFDIILL